MDPLISGAQLPSLRRQLYALEAVEHHPESRPPPGGPVLHRRVSMKIGSMAKAIVSGAAAGITALVGAMADDVIVTGEWVTVVLAVLGALGVTYAVPNAAQSDQNRVIR